MVLLASMGLGSRSTGSMVDDMGLPIGISPVIGTEGLQANMSGQKFGALLFHGVINWDRKSE